MLYSRTLFIPPIYTSLSLLIPNSKSFPPLPHPLVATSLFTVSVSLLLFHGYMLLWCILDSTDKRYHMVFVFWLLLLSMIISRSLYAAANGIISFFLIIFHCVCVYHIFFIHSSVSGQLKLFPCLGYCK